MLRRKFLTLGMLGIVLSFAAVPVAAQEPALLLFDGETGKIFAGCLNCNKYDDASVCNRYGDYGSRYSDKSIWSRYGNFGSRYSNNSPWSRYGDGLRVVDQDGNYYGRFTRSSIGRSRLPIVQSLLAAFDKGIDLQEIRDAFCDG